MNYKDSLKVIMKELISGYTVLQCLLQREKECLINLNVSQFESLSKEKDTVVMRLRLLEEEKKRLLKNYCIDSNINSDPNHEALNKILTEDASLQPLLLQLISLIQNIRELNEFNRILVDRSITFHQNALAFLQSRGIFTNHSIGNNTISKEA